MNIRRDVPPARLYKPPIIRFNKRRWFNTPIIFTFPDRNNPMYVIWHDDIFVQCDIWTYPFGFLPFIIHNHPHPRQHHFSIHNLPKPRIPSFCTDRNEERRGWSVIPILHSDGLRAEFSSKSWFIVHFAIHEIIRRSPFRSKRGVQWRFLRICPRTICADFHVESDFSHSCNICCRLYTVLLSMVPSNRKGAGGGIPHVKYTFHYVEFLA